MAVHIVYRSHYAGPSLLQRKTFDDPTVLDWFRNHWDFLLHYDAHTRLEELLGFDIYGFGNCFDPHLGASGPPPSSIQEMHDVLTGTYHDTLLVEPHVVQVLTDDDEIQLAYYLFDDHFLAERGYLAAFLLHPDFELPVEVGQGGFEPAEPVPTWMARGTWEGTTYAVSLYAESSDNLELLNDSCRLDGVRLPQLARHLLRLRHDEEPWWREFGMIRSELLGPVEGGDPTEEAFLAALRASPEDEVTWRVYSDWLLERSQATADIVLLERSLRRNTRLDVRPSHDPVKSAMQVAEHVAQLGKHTAQYGFHDDWDRWIFFDDLWASAQPDLANAILRHGMRWDVLSPLGAPRPESD